MKTFKLFYLSLFALFLMSSCTKEPKEMIIGEWKITDIQTTREIPDEIKDAYEEQIKENIEASSLVLKRDGTFENTNIDGTYTGTWKLNDDATLFTINYDEGNEELSTINELTETKFSITSEINDAKNTIVYKKIVKE